ncbi:glycosyl hydrolase [Caldimonas brevitalea]|uniref:Asl1-like glycosyl hydrolase catalytic domain-containing protein n=1 Tax=Caldimonas brevitalea TaxID=413882 RepID=A0A0G3BES4_9BURK|nr:glycosyl hydrolase [Caldimonas brevitalea]AKJ27919.1 hypothetical protein AAW51_1228 [Caldimonas brevitalea]
MAVTDSDNLVTAASNFEGTYTRFAPGWNVNYWGSVKWEAARESRSGYVHSGTSAQRFRVLSRSSGADAHLIFPHGFVNGKSYRAVVYVRTDTSAQVEVMLRRDAQPWDVTAAKTVSVGSGWTRVEVQGRFRWNSPGSLRVISKTVGANIYVDDAQISAVEEAGDTDVTGMPLPAAGGASTTLTQVFASNFDDVFSYTSTGWRINVWGEPLGTFQAGRETRAGYVHSGASSQRFRMLTTGGGDAHLIYPFPFVKGRTYRATAYMRADSSATAELFIRRDAPPWDAAGTRTVTLGTSWQKVEVQGIYLGDVVGSLRVASKTPGANIYVDSVKLEEVKQNDLAPASTTTVPNTLFGIHVKRLGNHFNFPQTGHGLLRLWNTGTNWRDLEKANNVWDFTTGSGKRLELYVDYAQRNNAQILYTLGQTPAWASSNPSVQGYYGLGASMPPTHLEDWRDYVRTLARRYAGKIRYWELWNESDFSGTWAGSVEKMVEMARIAREEIKAADPANQLVSPGLTTGQGVAWLDRFLAAGGGNHVDVIGFHWYYDMQPEKLAPQIQNVRQVIKNHGLEHKPLWNTEGAPLCNSSLVDCATWTASVAEQRSVNARALMIMWAKGVSNFNYYWWERGESQGRLVQDDFVTQTAGGHALAEAIKWIKGARLVDSFKVQDKVYVFRINRGTENYTVLWSTTPGTSVTIPSSWGITRLRTLAGQESSLASATFTLGIEPVMLK